MATCPSCGAQVDDNAAFCTKCGAAIKDVPGGFPPTPPVSQPTATGTQSRTPSGGGPPPFQPPPPTRKKAGGLSKGAKTAIIAGVAAVVIIIVAVVILLVFFINIVTGPADVANGFMEALETGDLDAAWEYLAATTQEMEGRKSFEQAVDDFVENLQSYYTRGIEITGGAAEVEMEFTLDSGQGDTWYFYLVKEDGDWRILRFIPEPDPDFD